jgi:hypothetical protein
MALDRRLRRGILVAVLLVALILTLPIALTPGVRTRLTEALSERFGSDVDLEALRVSVFPRLRVQGEGVALRHKGRTDVPPLISIASFSAEANIVGLFTRPLRLVRVELDQLEINIPPGGMDINDDEDDGQSDEESPLIVGELLAERTILRVLRSDTTKRPRVWEIAHLRMEDTGSNAPWPFVASLTNPTPPGEITTQGTFGPWNTPQPSQTPLDAEYEFRNADLGAFDGIRGILHSTGEFSGVLERIEVNGSAGVPDFALDKVGNPVPLSTRFHAVVDGTNGNTWLQPVDGQLGRSSIRAEGEIVEDEGEDGRTIELDVVMNDARIEDVLRLAMKSAMPFMTGALKLKTKLVLPPGDRAAIEKLRLNGAFQLASARFTKGNVQEKMNELSQKARGEGDSDEPPDRVVSDFTGEFVMRNGVIQFSDLTFAVPGAKVDLAGNYTVRSEELDFKGTVRLEAKLSELTTGVKSFLLKLVDPLMRRKDVTVIPVTVKGTAEKPDFGLDIKRAFTPG